MKGVKQKISLTLQVDSTAALTLVVAGAVIRVRELDPVLTVAGGTVREQVALRRHAGDQAQQQGQLHRQHTLRSQH